MHSFLKRSVDRILTDHPDGLENVCIVLPGQRPMIFLREILSENLAGFSWGPPMLTIEQFMSEVSGKQRMGQAELLFTAYEVYRTVAKKPEDFDSFLTWIPPLLADFNEVDNYHSDGQVVFTNLMEIRGIEDWSFGEDELSPTQEKFQQRWELMGELYRAMRKRLLEGQEVSTGLMRRIAAEAVSSGNWTSPWKKIYFLGFNALSEATQQVFFGLEEQGLAVNLWDGDRAFVDPSYHEAGLFMRRFEKKYGRLDIPQVFDPTSIQVQTHETTSRLAQVKVMANLLSEPGLEPEKTAIILGDESLLIPALNSIPLAGDFNITLGYSLRMTPAFDLLRLLPDVRKRCQMKGSLWYQDIVALSQHPVLAQSIAGREVAMQANLSRLAKANLAYVPRVDFERLFPENPSMTHIANYLFAKPDTPIAQVESLRDILEALELAHEGPAHRWMREMIFLTIKALNQTIRSVNQADFDIGLSSVQLLLRKAVGTAQIDFRGEPKRGLQIMGMLETRALGFERVIIVGANEGHMPSNSRSQSYIPFELKKHYHLPTHRERDAIYAYYFFRLLQETKQVDFIYATQGESLGSAERSRYIAQLEHMRVGDPEPPSNWVLKLPDNDPFPNIQQDDLSRKAIIRQLENGLSPSALNTYLRCPLDFYFKYALQFREPDEVEESFSDALFGTLVHDMLEHLYLHGKERHPEKSLSILLSPEKIASCATMLPALMQDILDRKVKFAEQLPHLESGLNRLTMETAVNYVKQFLQWEMEQAKEAPCTLLFLESAFSREVMAGEQKVRIKGKIDRIDLRNGQIRIIDYKTGNVSSSEVKARETAEEMLNPGHYKARQLVMYDLMTEGQSWRTGVPVICGMISLRKLSAGFVAANVESKEAAPISDDQKAAFLDALETACQQMLAPNAKWEHETESNFCAYCEA